MKRHLLWAFLLTSSLTYAIPNEKEVASTIQLVKVFRQGAQVGRTSKTAIPAGETILKFIGLSPDLDPQSIQVRAEGSFTLLAVNYQLNYLREVEKSDAYQKLLAERDALQGRIDREQIVLQVLADEENFILANKDIGGTAGLSVERLKTVTEYYRLRLSEIRFKKLEVNAGLKKLQEELAKVQRQINELSSRANQPTGEILVKVRAKAATSGNFELNYLVRKAGWSPAYDLQVKDINSPVTLTYKANVSQNTGEDWTKVQLSLSTGNPSRPGVKPELQIWRLGFYNPIVFYDRRKDANVIQKSAPQQAYAREEAMVAERPEVEIVEGTTAFEFRIEMPYDVPADGKQYTVELQEYSVPAYYEYYTAPKLDPTAYLTAQLTDWEKYNLVNGEANLYFEGAFLGKSFLDVQSTEDTLTISLGRDESIVVSRTKETQIVSSQFIGNKKTEVRGWTIELRNKKKQPINIVVEDQYPIPISEEIEVVLETAKGATVDKEIGKLTWKLNIAPNQAEKLYFRYTVKLPKKKRVILE